MSAVDHLFSEDLPVSKRPTAEYAYIMNGSIAFGIFACFAPYFDLFGVSANDYCKNDCGAITSAITSQEFFTSLVVSLSVSLPIIFELLIDSFSDYGVTDEVFTRWTLVLTSLFCDLLILYAIVSSKDLQLLWSAINARDILLFSAVFDNLRRRELKIWDPKTCTHLAIGTIVTVVFRERSLGIFYYVGNIFGGLASVAAIVLFMFISKRFYKSYQASLSNRSAGFGIVATSPLIYWLVITVIGIGYLSLFVFFGPVRLCDITGANLAALNAVFLVLELVVGTMLRRQSKLEALRNRNSLEMKRMFVRYVSHEIRTPLNTVSTGLNLLRSLHERMYSLDHAGLLSLCDNIFDMSEEMKDSCDIAINILNDLLLYEKLEGGILQLEKKVHPADDVVYDSIQTFSIQAREAGIEFICNLDDAVGGSKENNDADSDGGVDRTASNEGRARGDRQEHTRVFVDVDKPKIGQVLRNLVSNGIKFTPRGGKVTVNASYNENDNSKKSDAPAAPSSSSSSPLSSSSPGTTQKKSSASTPLAQTRCQGPYIRITVRDTGAGLTSENQAKLFKQIIQFNAGELQKGGGSGLGLFISSGIMDLHEGGIGVYSEGEGCGSVFYIDIPATLRVSHEEGGRGREGDGTPSRGSSSRGGIPSVQSAGSISHTPSNEQQNSGVSNISSPSQGELRANSNGTSRVGSGTTTPCVPNAEGEGSEGDHASRRTSHDSTASLAAAAGAHVAGGGGGGSAGGSGTPNASSGGLRRRGDNRSRRNSSSDQELRKAEQDRINRFSRGSDNGYPSTAPSGSVSTFIAMAGNKSTSVSGTTSPLAGQHESSSSSSASLYGRRFALAGLDFNAARADNNSAYSDFSFLAAGSVSSDHSGGGGGAGGGGMNSGTTTPGRSGRESPVSSSPQITLSKSVSGLSSLVEQGNNIHVLIVDDSTTNRKMLVRLLRLNSICNSPSEAEDGQAAVDFVTKQIDSAKEQLAAITSAGGGGGGGDDGSSIFPSTTGLIGPDAILMDYVMPRLSGPDATMVLRSRGYQGLIIGVTGNALPEDIDHFLKKGADAVLTKPIDTEELKRLLQQSASFREKRKALGNKEGDRDKHHQRHRCRK